MACVTIGDKLEPNMKYLLASENDKILNIYCCDSQSALYKIVYGR